MFSNNFLCCLCPSNTPGSNEGTLLREVGEGTVYNGQEPQGNTDSAIQNFSHNKQAILSEIVEDVSGLVAGEPVVSYLDL